MNLLGIKPAMERVKANTGRVEEGLAELAAIAARIRSRADAIRSQASRSSGFALSIVALRQEMTVATTSLDRSVGRYAEIGAELCAIREKLVDVTAWISESENRP